MILTPALLTPYQANSSD